MTVTISPIFIELRVQPRRIKPFGLPSSSAQFSILPLSPSYVDIEEGVRVGPGDLRDGARELDRAVRVELGRERVVRDRPVERRAAATAAAASQRHLNVLCMCVVSWVSRV